MVLLSNGLTNSDMQLIFYHIGKNNTRMQMSKIYQ